jgi:hypothetical protein
MKNQHQFMINIGKKFQPALKDLIKKEEGAVAAGVALVARSSPAAVPWPCVTTHCAVLISPIAPPAELDAYI